MNGDLMMEVQRGRVARWKGTRLAYLGDGLGRVFVAGSNGNRAYVRFPSSGSDSLTMRLSPPVTARWRMGAAIVPREGTAVRVGYDVYDELTIVEADSRAVEAQGISAQMANPMNPVTRYVYPEQMVIGKLYAFEPATTAVGWQSIVYEDQRGALRLLAGPSSAANGLNLAPYIPGAGLHRIVVVWLDTYLNGVTATASAPKAMTVPLDMTDFSACDAERPADSIPLGSVRLRNQQPKVDSGSIYHDIRPFLARPWRFGETRVVERALRVWPEAQRLAHGSIVVAAGSITVLGEMVVI